MSGSVGEAPDRREGRKVWSGVRRAPTPSLPHDALLDCCRSIHEMTSEIGEALRSNNGEVLIAKLQERQNLIEEMGSLQAELNVASQRLHPSTVPDRERGRGEMMEEIKTLLEAILSLDEVHKGKIIRKSEKLSQQLKKFYDGRQLLRSSYMTFPASRAKLVDVV